MTNLFQQTFQRLEKRLQALIEGNTARLFPSYSFRIDLGKRLVDAMRGEIRPDSNGVLTAPNLFTIFLPEEQAQVFQDQHELLEELSDSLRQACQDAQVSFISDPVVKVIALKEPDLSEIQIIAQFSSPPEESTSVLEPRAAENTADQAHRAFLIVDGTRVFPLAGKIVCIGKSTDNDLVINHPQVSLVHAQLRRVNGLYMIFDLNSAAGTFVNGIQVSQCPLSPGDVISLGGLPLVFGLDQNADADRTQELSLLS